MIKVGTIVALLGLIVAAVMGALARRRAVAQEQAGGCVACGAHELEIRGPEQVCRRCGYVGRADRGGALSQQELASLHAPDRDPW
jgi:cytochrome c551/c552